LGARNRTAETILSVVFIAAILVLGLSIAHNPRQDLAVAWSLR
jgi:hypothetical protein